MNPVFSATPTPRSATSTTPSGANPVNVVTSRAMNVASASPVSWFWIRTGSPVTGWMSANWIGASSTEAIQVRNSSSRKRIAGSGSLLPTTSMAFRNRLRSPFGLPLSACCASSPAFAIRRLLPFLPLWTERSS